jgi:hypothetical protein
MTANALLNDIERGAHELLEYSEVIDQDPLVLRKLADINEILLELNASEGYGSYAFRVAAASAIGI